jgi:hypothetical protein
MNTNIQQSQKVAANCLNNTVNIMPSSWCLSTFVHTVCIRCIDMIDPQNNKTHILKIKYGGLCLWLPKTKEKSHKKYRITA